MAQAISTQAQAATGQAQAMMAQENREVVPRRHQQVTTMASRLRDFTQMNPPTFYGSKVEEDPQEFINKVYKILLAMGLSTSEKAELSTYQLKDVVQAWYVQWRGNRPLRGGPLTWDILNVDFLDPLLPREISEEKVVEFINLRQGGRVSMSTLWNSLNCPNMLLLWSLILETEWGRFVMGVSEDLQEECHSAMLHDNMNISRHMVHARRVEEVRAKRKK